MRSFRYIENNNEMFIYPVPVIPDSKYLIKVGSRDEGEDIMIKIYKGEIKHPDTEDVDFELLKLHGDGKTKIFITRK
ncbi:MAG TPA: hypothetical protein VNJ08_14510 [Bacteriovoracaceae bacterium]|nr:hypothetical protein [Bacteriovoracaceae bacterium]